MSFEELDICNELYKDILVNLMIFKGDLSMENNNEHITIEQLNAMEERLNKKIDDSSNSGCLFLIVIILLASIWGIETKIDNVQDQIKDTKTELYEQIDRIIP